MAARKSASSASECSERILRRAWWSEYCPCTTAPPIPISPPRNTPTSVVTGFQLSPLLLSAIISPFPDSGAPRWACRPSHQFSAHSVFAFPESRAIPPHIPVRKALPEVCPGLYPAPRCLPQAQQARGLFASSGVQLSCGSPQVSGHWHNRPHKLLSCFGKKKNRRSRRV